METVTTKSKSLPRIEYTSSIFSLACFSILRVTLAIVLLSNSLAHASSWQLRKGVSLSLGVVRSDGRIGDDAGLLGEDFRTDRTISISPFISVSRQTRLLSFTGRAGVVYRDTESQPNARVDPSAAFTASATLIDNTLWLDSSARGSRRLVSGSIIDDANTLPDEATDVYEFSIGPRWEQQLSRSVRVAGVYQYSIVGGRGSLIQGSDSQAVGVEIVKALSAGKTQLGLRFEGQRDSFDTNDIDGTARAETVIGVVDHSFKSNLDGRLFIGWDQLKTATRDFDEQSTLYGAGITWEPTRRLFIDAEYSERVFGSKPAVSIRLQGRVSSIEFTWSRTTTILQGLVFGDDETVGAALDPVSLQTGEIGAEVSLDDIDVGSFAPFASESENVNEEIALTYRLQGRVSSFVAILSRLEQERLATPGGERANKIQLILSRNLSKSLQLTFSVSAIDGETVSEENTANDLRRQDALLTLTLQL